MLGGKGHRVGAQDWAKGLSRGCLRVQPCSGQLLAALCCALPMLSLFGNQPSFSSTCATRSPMAVSQSVVAFPSGCEDGSETAGRG